MRKGLGGGGSGVNIQSIVLGVIVIVMGLIMLGIGMDTVDTLIGANSTVDWTNYSGGEAMLEIFPLLMMISLVLFGGVLIWVGYGGSQMSIRDTIMVTIVVVVAVILLPLVIDNTDALLERSDIGNYTGLESFLGLIPLLYIVGIMTVTGLLAFKSVRGKVGTGRRRKATKTY